MANKYVAIRDGGKTNEEGAQRLLAKLAGSQNEGIIGTSDFGVAEESTPDMGVDIAVGDLVIEYNDYFYHCFSKAVQNLTISAADPSNARKDRVVAYVDLSVVDDTNSNNPDAILFADVAGTPAGSPAEPDDSAVQTAVGAGNPWAELAMVDVGAGVTSITDSDITDRRSQFQLGGGAGGAQFALKGDAYVANDLTPYWVATRPGTFISSYVRAKTAPTGADLIVRLNKNGVQITTITISAGSQTGSSTGLSVAYVAGDYFSFDITQIGSTVAGANITAALG